jgi:hypothetical protein
MVTIQCAEEDSESDSTNERCIDTTTRSLIHGRRKIPSLHGGSAAKSPEYGIDLS